MMKTMFCKKVLSMAAMSAVMAFGFSACDDDVDESVILSGEWEGNFGTYYNNEDGFPIKASITVLNFEPDYDYATHGDGYEIDYYSKGRIEEEYFYFKWKINDGVISLRYPYDEDLDVDICDYHIDSDIFTGRFTISGTKFTMVKTTDYYDWTSCREFDHKTVDRESSKSRADVDYVEVQGTNETPKKLKHGRDLNLMVSDVK